MHFFRNPILKFSDVWQNFLAELSKFHSSCQQQLHTQNLKFWEQLKISLNKCLSSLVDKFHSFGETFEKCCQNGNLHLRSNFLREDSFWKYKLFLWWLLAFNEIFLEIWQRLFFEVNKIAFYSSRRKFCGKGSASSCYLL